MGRPQCMYKPPALTMLAASWSPYMRVFGMQFAVWRCVTSTFSADAALHARDDEVPSPEDGCAPELLQRGVQTGGLKAYTEDFAHDIKWHELRCAVHHIQDHDLGRQYVRTNSIEY